MIETTGTVRTGTVVGTLRTVGTTTLWCPTTKRKPTLVRHDLRRRILTRGDQTTTETGITDGMAAPVAVEETVTQVPEEVAATRRHSPRPACGPPRRPSRTLGIKSIKVVTITSLTIPMSVVDHICKKYPSKTHPCNVNWIYAPQWKITMSPQPSHTPFRFSLRSSFVLPTLANTLIIRRKLTPRKPRIFST